MSYYVKFGKRVRRRTQYSNLVPIHNLVSVKASHMVGYSLREGRRYWT